jgi:hypothetical protein
MLIGWSKYIQDGRQWRGRTTSLLGLALSSVTTSMLSTERGETGVRVYPEDVLQGAVK